MVRLDMVPDKRSTRQGQRNGRTQSVCANT